MDFPHLGEETLGGKVYCQCVGCWTVDCITAEIAKQINFVKGLAMRMTTETDAIESNDWQRLG